MSDRLFEGTRCLAGKQLFLRVFESKPAMVRVSVKCLCWEWECIFFSPLWVSLFSHSCLAEANGEFSQSLKAPGSLGDVESQGGGRDNAVALCGFRARRDMEAF